MVNKQVKKHLLILVLLLLSCREVSPVSSSVVVEPVPEIQGYIPPVLRLGVKPFLLGPNGRKENFAAFSNILARELGYPVALIASDSVEELGKLMLIGELDLLITTSVGFVSLLSRDAPVELVATLMVKGDVEYSAYLVVNDSSSMRTLADLKGGRIGLTNYLSGSGFVVPLSFLLERGFSSQELLETVFLHGDHMGASLALSQGLVDTFASFFGGYGGLCADAASCGRQRVLAVSGRMPYEALLVNSGLNLDMRNKIKELVVKINTSTPLGREAFAHQSHINGFTASHPGLYEDIGRRAATVWEIFGELAQ